MFVAPLEKMKLTQPFGVNYVGGDFYSKIGLHKGHNGWDLVCPNGTPVFAVADGYIHNYDGTSDGYGKNVRLFTGEEEVTYGHLLNFKVPHGESVKAGQLVAMGDNTGYSTGPHLHIGIRKRKAHNAPVDDYNNGFYGYVDPTPFFPEDIFWLPVDKKYGETKPGMGWKEWQDANVFFYKETGRLMTNRERYAFMYGYWDLRTVLDDSMFPVWSQMHKPEAIKRGIIKNV